MRQQYEVGREGGREVLRMQRWGDKSCSDQVSLVPSHLSLFLEVINQSQTAGIDRPLTALAVFTLLDCVCH